MNDPVFTILQGMLAASPERSYKRLNPALRSTLSNCIQADLPFQKNTFRDVFNKLRGHWWFGDGAGNYSGEHYYSLACRMNHASACQSFEAFAERPGVLWEEDCKTTFRLHVGVKFTWKGHYVEVTSMRKDSLVACTYRESRGDVGGLNVGARICYDDPHVITAIRREDGATWLRVIKTRKGDYTRTVAKRFTISYEEISKFRRSAKERIKKIISLVEACDPEKDREKLTKAVAAEHFRHFELEEINAAFSKRRDWIAKQTTVEEWRSGRGSEWLDTKDIVLRIKGDRVQCSNGNHVSLSTVRRVLPILLDRRNDHGSLSLNLDSYTVQNVSEEGVTVGCTLVPWAEVDWLAAQLKPMDKAA